MRFVPRFGDLVDFSDFPLRPWRRRWVWVTCVVLLFASMPWGGSMMESRLGGFPGQQLQAQPLHAQPVHAQPVHAQDLTGAPGADSTSGATVGSTLGWLIRIFLLLCVVGLLLMVVSAVLFFWYAKRLIENAVKPNLPRLERIVARMRRKHPDLSEEALAKKIIFRQSNQAGLVGFVTGLGGLPFLPIAVPIDIAASIKIQSNLVHLLRILRGPGESAADVSDASLWLITTGGHEITTASSTVVRELLVKYLSKSLLKFLPVLGGVIGFLLNWISTQALGRLSMKWLDKEIAPSPAPAVETAV